MPEETVETKAVDEDVVSIAETAPSADIIAPIKEEVIKKEDKFNHVVYAYITDEEGAITGAYQGKNPPEEYIHVFDYPLPAGSSIQHGEVVVSESFIKQEKAAIYAEINKEYQEKLEKLASTITYLELQNIDSTQAKAAYIKLQQQYKNALLDVANITVKE